MIAFVLIAAVMIGIAVACVLVPLLRGAKPAGVAREASNVDVFRDQLAELDADLASGAMPRERYDEARREIEQRVLEDSTPGAPGSASPTQSAAWTAAILAGAIPVVALVLYVALGNFDAFAPGGPRVARDAGGEHEVTREQIDAMAAKLAQRLEREPENAEGWAMLARTYYALNRYDDAVPAFERATALTPNDAGLLADYADAVGAAEGGLHGKAQALIARALAVDPTHWKALALAGTAAFERKEYQKAADYWEKTKAGVPPDSPIARSIDSSIAEARQLGGLPPAAGSSPAQIAAAAPSRTPAKGGAAPPAPSPNVSVAAGAPGAMTSASVAGTVSLAPALAAKVTPTDTVFIFARAAEGPRMQLAILRKQVKDLPAAFTLDDSMAMTPNFALSKFPSVVVGARVSKSGNAAPQTGDLEGFSPVVKTGATGLSVVIDRALP
ncbi:MAG TPA: c-type cytochrome biogenesis protein CcmI [Casimicrobiaceae bacterium]|nr:c-type cytochrome biogenesis protein CcmI [Casimicrobiaceae bacterium]